MITIVLIIRLQEICRLLQSIIFLYYYKSCYFQQKINYYLHIIHQIKISYQIYNQKLFRSFLCGTLRKSHEFYKSRRRAGRGVGFSSQILPRKKNQSIRYEQIIRYMFLEDISIDTLIFGIIIVYLSVIEKKKNLLFTKSIPEKEQKSKTLSHLII